MKFVKRLFPLIVLLSIIYIRAEAQRQHTLTGEFRSHKAFHSKFLKNDRDVLVYLPPGYDANTNRRYSVLYLHDGQNVFDGATSFIAGQEWQVDETAQRLIQERLIEPLIIVGIYNTPDRISEYTPAPDPKFKGGNADAYGHMIVEELKPFIDAHYRTKRDPKHTGIGGSSLGALISGYLALKYPNVFGKAAVVSPSVWFANKEILRYIAQQPKKPDVRLWVDIGTKEGRNEAEAKETVEDARLLRDALVAKHWRLGKDFKYFEAEGAEHNEKAWAARVEPILRFLFPLQH
jgi:predicted alpha/beta superfamily hydrolase